MILLDGQLVFGRGPHDLRVGALGLRYTVSHAPAQTGVDAHVDGIDARELTLVGWLTADTRGALDAKVAAIEEWIDGCEHTLRDGDRQFEHVIVTAFTPGLMRRIGPRVGMKYEARLLQLQP